MKNLFQKGQTAVPIIIVTALLTSSGNWLLSRLFNSPDVLSASIGTLNSQVAVLKSSDATQDSTIAEMKSNIEYIRRSLEEQNRRQGIVINESTVVKKP